MAWYQQGDVMIKPVGTIPERGQRVTGAVLAEGEATGHRHVASGEAVAVLEFDGARYLDAPAGARITHCEHKEIALPPGQYQVDIVREYDHFHEVAPPPAAKVTPDSTRPRRVARRSSAVRRVRD